MPLSLPSADIPPTKPDPADPNSDRAGRLRVWVEKLVAHIDKTAPPEYPSTWQEWGGAGIDDGAADYGAEYGGRPDFVVADDVAWKG